MERYSVRFLKGAVDDLEDIILYIAGDSKTAAIRMHDIILEKAEGLSVFPKRGRLLPDKRLGELRFRMLPVGKYIIFYKIDDDKVHIHRVLHGARNYPMLFGEIQGNPDEDI